MTESNWLSDGLGRVRGDEEAGCAEAERASGEVGGGDAVGFGDGGVGLLGDVSERLTLAVQEGVGRWLTDVLDGEAHVEARNAPVADGRGRRLERASLHRRGRAAARRRDTRGRCRSREERSTCGEIWSQSAWDGLLGRGTDASEPLTGGLDGAGVDRGKGDGLSGRERVGKGDECLGGLAGMVGVCEECVFGERVAEMVSQ